MSAQTTREKGLEGLRLALLESRLSEELASLVRRHGAEPCCVPALREEPRPCASEVSALLDELSGEEAVFVCSTGVAVATLFGEARRLCRDDELREAMRRGTTVARGPKPAAALRREGLEASIRVAEPYTTKELIEALAPLDLEGLRTIVLHYGERNEPLVRALVDRKARMRELLLYEWRLPEDTRPLRRLVTEILEGRFGAVAFTTQVQVRHLFQIAAQMGRGNELAAVLRDRTVVAAVGPTCARALAELGVPPHVVPEHPKMGAMLTGLSEHLSRSRGPA